MEELITEGQNRLITRLTKNAELKYPDASIDMLDCEARGISKDTIERAVRSNEGDRRISPSGVEQESAEK